MLIKEEWYLKLMPGILLQCTFEYTKETSRRWAVVCRELGTSATGKTRAEASRLLQNTTAHYILGLNDHGILEETLTERRVVVLRERPPAHIPTDITPEDLKYLTPTPVPA